MRLRLCTLLVAWGLPASASATIVWTYDFPGSPGSGVGTNQTNSEPTLGTFGDWSRVNISALPTANAFDSNNWNTGSSIDPTQYASFTITANSGYHLNLSQISFDEMRGSGGSTKGEVDLFLNGSTTAYATFSYNPSASVQNKVFDFTDTTNADNVTVAEFRFYGWNGGTASAGLLFDNVATTVDIVPEFDCGTVMSLFTAMVMGCSAVRKRLSQRRA